jgi:hypothetical protein
MQFDGNFYNVEGYSDNCREFLKQVMLILMNNGDPERTRKAVQSDINKRKLRKPAEVKEIMPVIKALIDKHAAIKNHFDIDIGRRLQRLDSDVCDAVQTYFYNQDIPVLGVHDSFIIASEFEKKLEIAMKEAFFNKFKKMCNISKKGQKKE